MSRTYGKAQDLIDFTRASSGTALRRVKYGAELVTNGTFDADSDWTKGTGWSISGGVAVSSGSNNYAGLQQIASLTVGKVYSVTFTISSYTSGSLKFAIGSTTGNLYSSVGTFTENFVYIEPHASGKNVSIFPWGAFVGTIDNVSVKEVTFDTSDGDLILFNHPNNIPRIEYDANGNLLGLLVEEQRSNVIPKSESFTAGANGWFTIGASTSANQLGLDGQVNTANIVTSDTSTGSHLVANGATFTSGLTYTGSVFLKKGTQRYIKVSAGNPATWAANVVFDLDLASVDTETSGTGEIKSLGNGWYRCSITGDALASASTAFVISMLNDSKLGNFTGTGAETVIVYGAQLEAGSFPTSYIPTSGSTATRSADVASLSTSAFGYNQSAGSVVVDYRLNAVEPFATSAEFNDGTQNNRYGFVTSNLNQHRFLNVKNSSADVVIVGSSLAKDTQYIVAAAIKENDYVFAEGGSIVGTDSSASTPIVDTLLIGLTGSVYLNGHIKSIKYYPRRLTNAQLQELTS